MNQQTFKRIGLIVLILIVLMGVSVTTYVVAITGTGEGTIKKFEGVQIVGLPDTACMSSLELEPMPGMSLPFTMHNKGRVVVLFQGQFAGFNSRSVIRFTIDGNVVGSGIAVGNDHGTGLQTFGFNAFSNELEPGAHTLQVLWHTFPLGGTSCVEERSLIILRP
ncbi:MAG TPA: hypothetical protein VFZ34_09430 [Blastocatellia bacterium]|nr:hypothetical protein [Blastocatellia bacterium]